MEFVSFNLGTDFLVFAGSKAHPPGRPVSVQVMVGTNGEQKMSMAGISEGELINGSLVLTRKKCMDRGVVFHDVLNKMTGEKTEMMQTRLGSISMSMMRTSNGNDAGADVESNSMFCPTPDCVMGMDALCMQVAEDTPEVEQVLADCLAQAGIDPKTDFSMTVDYDSDGKSRIHVGRDSAQWQDIETLFDNNEALHSDVMRTWNQQALMDKMQVVENILVENAPSGQAAINNAWLQHGQSDFKGVQDKANTLYYSGGRLVFSDKEHV